MTEPFLGEIRMIGFDYAPRGWALCDGQKLPVAQNRALYRILGTKYGGNGVTSFGVPDLRERTAVHADRRTLQPGDTGGEETHEFDGAEIPVEGVDVGGGDDLVPAIGIFGKPRAHSNMQPYLVMNFMIALEGREPERY